MIGAIGNACKYKCHAASVGGNAELAEKTAAERIAQLEASNRELEEFAFAVSHDLKAPLRAVENAAVWLEQDLHDRLKDSTRGTIEILRSRVVRMQKLVDDLLSYARAGKSEDFHEAGLVAGDELVNNIVVLLSPPEGFTVKASPAFSEIRMPRMPLQQILMNLIGNSIKHHDKPIGRIEVSVVEFRTHYVFAVRDDGPGIPKRFHDRIFRAFQTLKPKDVVEGSGLGLAFVCKYVGAAGGAITLDSREGEGSIFSFTWPKQQHRRVKLHEVVSSARRQAY